MGELFTDLYALLWPFIYTMCGQTPGSLFYKLEGEIYWAVEGVQVRCFRLNSSF